MRMRNTESVGVGRRALVWVIAGVFALTGALLFEHDSGPGGVLLDSPTLIANGTPCGNNPKPNCTPCPAPHQNEKCQVPCVDDKGNTKPDCTPCTLNGQPVTDNKGEQKECHKPCVEGNGNPKNNCVPCPDKFDDKGQQKECKPCKDVDKKGNDKPKGCIPSEELT